MGGNENNFCSQETTNGPDNHTVTLSLAPLMTYFWINMLQNLQQQKSRTHTNIFRASKE